MNFKEKSSKSYVLFRGWIAIYFVDFKIIGETPSGDESIIHDFINDPQDFEVARKYVGGYFCNYTDEFGVTHETRKYNFGPYPIDQLKITDYIKVSVSDFEKKAIDLLSEVGEDKKSTKEFLKLIHRVKIVFSKLKGREGGFYQLLPPVQKFDEWSSFSLDWYLCGFSVDRSKKVLTIVQIDDD